MYCSKCGSEVSSQSNFCDKCGTQLNQIITNNSVSINTNEVMQHLEYAGTLEKRIYTIDKLMKKISQQIAILREKETVSEPKWKHVESSTIASCIFLFIVSWPVLYAIFCSHYPKADGLGIKSGIVSAVIGVIMALIAFILVKSENASLRKEYNKRVYENDVLYSQNMAKTVVLAKENEDLKQKKKQAEDFLQKIYNKNVLFAKYRNMVAVLTIYEYFMSGRCMELSGHTGAYNIFENEVRLNVIINKLDDIIYHLEDIKQNQYMLYEAIKEIQSVVDDLSYEFSSLSSSVSSLSDNQKVSAYNAKIAAENTKMLTYINLIK